MDLIRNILLAFEASEEVRISPKTILVGDTDADTIRFHIELLKEAGFIDHHIVQPKTRDGTVFMTRIDMGMRLTMDGYDFLESIKDATVWERTKAGAKSVGNASVSLIWEIARGYGRQLVKEKLGIEI
ncbi:DUF2513 domain-containing protein [Roseibium aestuarii]|uniref:DUF2513 domain-containing protein n=1 Tax=Roseibium aestuarii TaxID=2600299 RepID=A0ABW4K2P3_9HYPH|nr:DUF2513 domain-containing protein [Roseibium aestuarii]